MRLLPGILLAFPLLLATAACQAGAVENSALNVKLGDLGVGVEGVWGLTPDALRWRLGANLGSLGQPNSHSAGGINYDLSSHFKSLDALLDYHPFANDFRLTGGLFLNLNSYDVHAQQPSNGLYKFNGRIYSARYVGDLDGKLTFNKLAPYFGIGFGDVLGNNSRFTVTADFGFLYQGKPSLELNGSAVQDSYVALQRDMEVYRQQAEGGFNSLRWVPVWSGGIAYKW